MTRGAIVVRLRTMADLATLTLAASGTVAATGLGVLPVVALGAKRTARVRPGLAGFAAGSMAIASVLGLLEPGLRRGSTLAVAVRTAAGVAFPLAAQQVAGRRPATLAAGGQAPRQWLGVALLPVSFGFAAGAMLALTVVDLLPEALPTHSRRLGVAGIAAGGAVMVTLARTAGV